MMVCGSPLLEAAVLVGDIRSNAARDRSGVVPIQAGALCAGAAVAGDGGGQPVEGERTRGDKKRETGQDAQKELMKNCQKGFPSQLQPRYAQDMSHKL